MNAIILTTKYFGPGGVERFGRQISRTAWDILKSKDIPLHLISLVDDPADAPVEDLFEAATLECFKGRKLLFALVAFWRVLVGARFVYVFHLHLAPIVFLVSLIRPSLKYGVHLHGIEAWRKLPFLRRISLDRAAIITASSKFTAERACEYNSLEGAEIKVIYPAYEHISFDSQDRKGFETHLNTGFDRYILSVARLDKTEKQKGIGDVLRALPPVLEKNPGLGYVVVGTGDDLERLKALARELEIAQEVLFPGRVSDLDLANYYSQCELFIMPSSKEGLGIVFLEAMSFSKPVIACVYGGGSEAVQDGETGILVEYGDIQAIRRSLIELIDNPAQAARMGRAGKDYLDSKFSSSRLREDLLSVVNALTKKPADLKGRKRNPSNQDNG